MRKGIIRIIENLRKCNISNERYVSWLENVNLPLMTINTINRYYKICIFAGQDTETVINEIQKYALLPAGVDELLYCRHNIGDTLLGKDAEKSDILNILSKSEIKAHAYNLIYREVAPYCDDKEVQALIRHLVDSYNDNRPFAKPWEQNINDEICKFSAFFRPQSRSACDNAAEIKELLWNDFTENKDQSVLYKAWDTGYSIEILSNGGHNFSRSFSKQFKEFILKQDDPNRSLSCYFEYVNDSEYLEWCNSHYTIRQLRFNCKKALEDMKAENTNNTVIEEFQRSYPDIKIGDHNYSYDIELLTRMESSGGSIDFSVKSPFYDIQFYFSESGALNVTLLRYEETKSVHGTSSDDKNGFFGSGKYQKLDFFISKDGNAYYKHTSAKTKRISWYPLPMKKLVPYISHNVLVKLLETYSFITKNMFLRDVVNDMREYPQGFVSPITYADTSKYHNKAEYFSSTYKNADIIKWNYNKHNINLSYIVLKSLGKVAVTDYGILQNTPDDMIKYIEPVSSGRGRITKEVVGFLSGFYAEKEPTYKETAYDYINMCVSDKKSVVLHYSVHRMCQEHDHFSDGRTYASYSKKVETIQVPKNSKFIDLRKKLPDSFEWIKTKKRLIEESIAMHHCVWSYYSRINADICAIYSYFDASGEFDITSSHEPKRYTIEFTYNSTYDTYIINQIQSKYDRGGGVKLREYIFSLLVKDPFGEECVIN